MYISWEVSFSLTWSHPHSNNDDIQAYNNYHFPPVLSCRGQAGFLSVTGECEFFCYSSTSAMPTPLLRSTPGKTCVSSCLTSFGYQLKSELLRNVFLDPLSATITSMFSHLWASLMAQNIILIFFLLSIYHHLKLSLEKGVTIHSSMLAWRIPWTEEPGGLQSIGSQRVGHDWNDLTHMHNFIIPPCCCCCCCC